MPIASILLAAGRGRRLRPLTDAIPKPALPLLDVPLGAFGLTGLLDKHAPVLVNVSHLPDRVLDSLGPYGTFEVLREQHALGTAGTIAASLGRLADTFLTVNADALMDLDPGTLLGAHREFGGDATIAVRRVQRGADVIADEGIVTRFVDRRREPRMAGSQFIGVAAFERRAIERLPLHAPGGMGEQILAPLAAEGGLRTFEHLGYFTDVGTPDRYLHANLDVLHERGPALPTPLSGRMVEVAEGQAYVGPRAVVSHESLGPDAIVLAGATVARHAYLERTIVMPNASVSAERFEGVILFQDGRIDFDSVEKS